VRTQPRATALIPNSLPIKGMARLVPEAMNGVMNDETMETARAVLRTALSAAGAFSGMSRRIIAEKRGQT